ncbi:MAG: hypothetical protein OXU62_09910 [Gammaproteobacteria bacterium]|nr:hypothetical protein [Gammaproteobacteria bacterium]
MFALDLNAAPDCHSGDSRSPESLSFRRFFDATNLPSATFGFSRFLARQKLATRGQNWATTLHPTANVRALDKVNKRHKINPAPTSPTPLSTEQHFLFLPIQVYVRDSPNLGLFSAHSRPY